FEEMTSCDFVAGCIGGSAGVAVGHPLDTLKVKQQFGKGGTLWEVAVKSVRTEGGAGLFKGLLAPMLTAGGLNSLFFGVYAVSLQYIQGVDRVLSYPDIFLAGCLGGGAQLIVGCPIELIKVKLQTQRLNKFSGPWDCSKHIYKYEGVRGVYRGLTPLVWRDGPGFGLYMVIYEYGLHLLGGREKTGKMEQFISGGVAGMMAWLSVLPFDVLKSRLQADDPARPRYKNMVDCARQSYATDGAKVFTRGWLAMSLRAFPVNAITFLVYEFLLENCTNIQKHV
ncbi:mitochondrial basic amino acids transporter, partial [Eurytemora carolleeae]|uniref:mitochondrial basic amino acids transporter n=1 Tax=Eurytemora carolleeae TaxID=1294199 RepID=UPI000C786FD7